MKNNFRTTTPNISKEKKVAVILGYYNGDKYIIPQLRSILDQSYRNLDIFLADDHSSTNIDKFLLELEKDDSQRIHLKIRKNNVGFAKNFIDCLANIGTDYHYFAFSDQDDIWYNNKIERALSIVSQFPEEQPILYCARTEINDSELKNTLGLSPLFSKKPTFQNALVQNIGGGNTMLFNRAAYKLIVRPTSENVVAHDWWCYQIVSGAGGVVYYDPLPCLKYRQHPENVIGSNNNWVARASRARDLFLGKYKETIDIQIKALSENRDHLTSDNQKCLDHFIACRNGNLFRRSIEFKKSGIYRQTVLGNFGLLVGLLLNRI